MIFSPSSLVSYIYRVLSTHTSADLPDEYRIPSSSIEHLCIILVSKCQPAYLFLFPTHPSANLLDEYRSPSSSIEHFYILIVSKCQPVYLFPCIFSPFPTHPSTDLPDKYRSQFIYCKFLQPPNADLPTTSTCMAHNFPYSAKLFLDVLISIGVLILVLSHPIIC